MKKKHNRYINMIDSIDADLVELSKALGEDSVDHGMKEHVDDASALLEGVRNCLQEQKIALNISKRTKKKAPPSQVETFNAIKRVQEWSEGNPDDGLAADILLILTSPFVSMNMQTGRKKNS